MHQAQVATSHNLLSCDPHRPDDDGAPEVVCPPPSGAFQTHRRSAKCNWLFLLELVFRIPGYSTNGRLCDVICYELTRPTDQVFQIRNSLG
ncbi:hypothetical protein MPTK1_1g15080 [Marchantia polymorpha subsp. ruderalis]|uniref:Uncharacterized protein n=2 Tax=Marchantia polymorpha TaxID=3197 RepID=A0AAF6AQC4_MARPO|nr:hypothetical protein MARPO_0033s0153 [Marchantia polymorpha]BBM98644.1 hypothetical protein Mp_1g15080 [Marchantia polymorpha subsp. ruderalis]|eukprot:PTQ41765.1 hypothetical protein MARPO_0033s0153 [Marchantia polymorpha]